MTKRPLTFLAEGKSRTQKTRTRNEIRRRRVQKKQKAGKMHFFATSLDFHWLGEKKEEKWSF